MKSGLVPEAGIEVVLRSATSFLEATSIATCANRDAFDAYLLSSEDWVAVADLLAGRGTGTCGVRLACRGRRL
jgi:hypothetical protein